MSEQATRNPRFCAGDVVERLGRYIGYAYDGSPIWEHGIAVKVIKTHENRGEHYVEFDDEYGRRRVLPSDRFKLIEQAHPTENG